MEKYALLRGVDQGGFPLVHLVEPGSRHGLDATAGLDKTASHAHLPQVQELIESISPQPGRLYLVNSALGAGEYVGCNLRGDWFTESGLKHEPRGWGDVPVWDIDARRQLANQVEHVPGWGNLAWGYPTFYNAHRFRHHVNQDPERAYGFILGAFWDPRMHRVILVSELVKEMCAKLGASHIYERIEHGEFPDSSMGAKVPYDECTICRNLAKSPALYCKHINDQDPQFGRKKILPDGRICGMLNHQPRFFDDSFVFIGAERSAKVMSNITSLVKGKRPYSQTVYPFTSGMKMASAPLTEREDLDRRMVRSIARLEVAEKGPAESMSSQLDKVLRGIPVGNHKEKAALKYFGRRRSLKENDIHDENKELADLLEEKSLHRMNIDVEQYRHLDDEIDRRLKEVKKIAGHAKWAEILKKLPSHTPEYMSVVRRHANGLSTLPREALDDMPDFGHALTGCAHMGVVLKPEEFQYLALRDQDPGMASDLWESGRHFAPSAPEPSLRPSVRMDTPPPAAMLEVLKQILMPLLAERSFAPAAVRIRIICAEPAEPARISEEIDTPLLRKISSAYNEYRSALLETPPSWQNIPIGPTPMSDLLKEPKLASAVQELSHHLLCLAYWPVVPLGW